MDQLKTAVIGCGGHARSHFAMIGAEPRLHLSAIAELDPNRRDQSAAEYKPEKAFADYRQMLDETAIDLVYITTMPAPLTPIVLDCMDRGLHVSVEKPPGMSAAETAQMAEAANKSAGKSMVSFNRRYFPQVLAIRHLVQQQGGAVHCAATYNKPLTTLGTQAMAHLAPDPLICDAIHHVDLLRWLAGPTPETAAHPIAVHSTVFDGNRPGAHRHNALIQFDSGAAGVLMSHYGVGYRIQRAEVHGEDLSAYLDLTSGQHCQLYRAQPDGTQPLEHPLDLESGGGADFNETKHFVDCILNDQSPWSSLDDAVHTMQLCEAIRRGHQGPL